MEPNLNEKNQKNPSLVSQVARLGFSEEGNVLQKPKYSDEKRIQNPENLLSLGEI